MLVGVHANVCVVNRSYGLRNMRQRFQKNIVLVRDLTDVMYDPRRAPMYDTAYIHVSRNRGLELVIEYIEKHIAPTIASTSLLGGEEFIFGEDTIYVNDQETQLIIQ